jgi:hypothetical protein
MYKTRWQPYMHKTGKKNTKYKTITNLLHIKKVLEYVYKVTHIFYSHEFQQSRTPATLANICANLYFPVPLCLSEDKNSQNSEL